MSRRIVGNLMTPDGSPLANVTLSIVATQNESVAILKSARFSFTTGAAGEYDETLVDGTYRVMLDYNNSIQTIGEIIVEAGPDTTLEALL